MPKANSSLGRQDNRSPKEPKRQGHWHRQRPLPPSRHHYVGSYHALPGGASDLRRSDIPERQDYGHQRTLSDEHYSDYSHSAYPPPLMDFSTVAESDIDLEAKKSMFRNVMRSVGTFMVQAQNNESDLNILREALLDIISEKEGSSSRNLDQEMLNSLVKRLEICETRQPDASTLERLSALEQRVNIDSSTFLARIERLEEKVFETRNVENDCEIVEASKNESPKLDQRNKKARCSQPSSSLFPTPSQGIEKIESNSKG